MDPAPALATIDGRRAFGHDAANYDEARPPYPDRVFEILGRRCGLGPGTRTFEVGPGTGLATRPMLAMGASPLVAIEPDARLAAVLRARSPEPALDVVVEPFEAVELASGTFDLGCSATAFHWLEQRSALLKVAASLRRGGWWAMWWNVFGDSERSDPFHEATKSLLAHLPRPPSQPLNWQHPFALDTRARLADLEATGAFEDIAFENLRWTLVLDAPKVRALYASYSHFGVLEPTERNRVLDQLEDVALRRFGNRIERNMCTAIYTCRRR